MSVEVFAKYCSWKSSGISMSPEVDPISGIVCLFPPRVWYSMSDKELNGSADRENCPSPEEDRFGGVRVEKLGPVAGLGSFVLSMLIQTAEHNAVTVLSFAMYDNRDGVAAWLLIRSATNSRSGASSGEAIDTSSMVFLYKSTNVTSG